MTPRQSSRSTVAQILAQVMRALMLAALLTPLAAGGAMADAAAIARGEKVVDEWCRDCHVQDGQDPGSDMAPAYADIVAVEGRDRAWFEQFLKDDHFPMTTFRLFDHEKADVVEWLLDLQRRAR
jgi:mono/diheme cytochrome c family protein